MKKTNTPNRCFNHHATGSAAAHHFRAGRRTLETRRWWGQTQAAFAEGLDYFWSRRPKALREQADL